MNDERIKTVARISILQAKIYFGGAKHPEISAINNVLQPMLISASEGFSKEDWLHVIAYILTKEYRCESAPQNDPL